MIDHHGPWPFALGSVVGRIGRLYWWNADPSGSVCVTGTPHWGKTFWSNRALYPDLSRGGSTGKGEWAEREAQP